MGTSLDWSGYKTKVDSLSTDLQGQIKTLLSDKITDGYIKISDVLDLETTATPYAIRTNYYKGEDQLVVNTAAGANYKNSYPCTKLKNLKFSDISKDNTECLLKWAGDGKYTDENSVEYTETGSYVLKYIHTEKKLTINKVTNFKPITYEELDSKIIASPIIALCVQAAGGGGGAGLAIQRCGAGGGAGGACFTLLNMVNDDLKQFGQDYYMTFILLGTRGTGGDGILRTHGTDGKASSFGKWNEAASSEENIATNVIQLYGGGGGKSSFADTVSGGAGGKADLMEDCFKNNPWLIEAKTMDGAKGGDAGNGNEGTAGTANFALMLYTLFNNNICSAEALNLPGGTSSTETDAKGGGGGASASYRGGNGQQFPNGGEYGQKGAGGGGSQGGPYVATGEPGGAGGEPYFKVYYLVD